MGLPAWFTESRVHLHSDGALQKFLNRGEDPVGSAGLIAGLGGTVWTRHVKLQKTGDPGWPSAEPKGPDGVPILVEVENTVKPLIDAAHEEGLRFIAYYAHQTDTTVEGLYPEAICRDPDGEPIPYKANKGFEGSWLDVTSPPYRDIVLARLLELAEMGADGYFFDETHLPLLVGGVWGTQLEEDYRACMGQEAPAGNDDADPVFLDYLRFHARRIEDTFAYWKKEVKAQCPDVAFVVSATTLPTLINHRFTTRLPAIADSTKNEFDLPIRNGVRLNLGVPDGAEGLSAPDDDIRQSFGWSLLRDAASGRPPHIWSAQFKEGDEALTFACALAGYGAIANLHLDSNLVLSPDRLEGKKEWYEEATAFGKQVAPYLAGPPMEWAAVHFGETARDARDGDFEAAWREVIAPAVGAFGAFVREGLPVRVVTDEGLAGIARSGYRALFVGLSDELTDEQAQAVAAFEEGGGAVLRNDPATKWAEPEGSGEAVEAFREELRTRLRGAPLRAPVSFADPPVDDAGGPARVHAVPYADPEGRRWLVAVLGDFSWVGADKPARGGETVEPPPPANVTLELRPEPDKTLSRVYELITESELAFEERGDAYRLNVDEVGRAAFILAEWEA